MLRLGVSAAAVAVVSCLALAAPASAAVLTAAYTGIVQDGVDFNGVFGAANADLSGAVFTATFTYDTSLGELEAGQETDLFGGVGRFAPSPVLSASVAINGVTVDLPSVDEGLVGLRPGEFITPTLTTNDVTQQASESFLEPNGVTYDSISLQMFARGVDLPTTFEGLYRGPVILGFGQLSFGSQTFGFLSPPITFDLTPDTLTIGPAGVPEPAAWVLMIGGFGLAGADLRRRRRVAAA